MLQICISKLYWRKSIQKLQSESWLRIFEMFLSKITKTDFFLPDFYFLNLMWFFFSFLDFLISWYVQTSVNVFDVYSKSSLDKCNDYFAANEIALMLFL